MGVYRGVIRSDATRAPLAAGAYATVFSQSVLEHIPDDQAAVREAARALAPGGRLVFTVPAPAFAERIRRGPGGEAALQATNQTGSAISTTTRSTNGTKCWGPAASPWSALPATFRLARNAPGSDWTSS